MIESLCLTICVIRKGFILDNQELQNEKLNQPQDQERLQESLDMLPADVNKNHKDLWTIIKDVRGKILKTKQVIPEELQLTDDIIPMERYNPQDDQGLTMDQVQDRISRGAVNTPARSASNSKKEIICSNIFTYFNLVFAVIAVMLILVGSFRDLTFLPVIIANTLIGIVQELRSKKALDDLRILNSPRVIALRAGKEKNLRSEELVLDDIILLGAGNQIPADCILTSGKVLVNEALLTGETTQIAKEEGDELLSGSFIISGECRARVDKVGGDTFVSHLTSEATKMKGGEASEMIRSLDRLVKLIGILIIPIAIILFSQQHFINGSSIRSSVTATAAAIVGMIPEGLYLLASVALAVSVMRLASQKVLVHNMKCIETLARADVLCVDKTGTITDNTMIVKKLLPLRKISGDAAVQAPDPMPEPMPVPVTDPAPGPIPAPGPVPGPMPAPGPMPGPVPGPMPGAEDMPPLPEEELFSPEEEENLEMLIGDFCASMATDNITMKAIKDYFRKRSGSRPDQIFSFSSATKYSGALFGEQGYVLGAPEFILRETYPEYEQQINRWGSLGYRVLVFAKYPGELDGTALTMAGQPLGMILLANPVRENAPETFAYFARQGVEIRVISGDNPVTVSTVAAEAGIPGAHLYVDASTLTSEEMLTEAAEHYKVFGRVSPEQKRILVNAMKQAGHTVAMTGDGVNDVLALKDADCSIAMASGSDAAAQVAQLVLLESDFSRMPSVVSEGRRVVNNIERTASLFLVKNIFSLLLSVFSIVLAMNYPLEPSQVSLISMFTIGIPAFFMALEKNTERIEGHFLSNVLFKALPGGLTDFLVVSAMYLFCLEFSLNEKDVSTAATIILAIVGMMILFKIASPMNRFHWILWFGMGAGLCYCMIFVSSIFGITSISRQCLMLLVIFAIVTEPTFRYISRLIKKMSEFYMEKKRNH